jgi:hypothetical protein
MFNSDTLADAASAILFARAERRLEALLAGQGTSDPNELGPAASAGLLRRAIIEAAAVDFPTANLPQMDHGLRSFAHPAFVPAWERVRSSTAIAGDALQMASGVDPAILLAGFGLRVAPFDFNQGVVEHPSNEIDAVQAMFSRWPNAFVGYSSCDAPFYVLVTDCVRTLREQAAAHPALFDVRRLFARSGGSLPADPGGTFAPGMALFARQPGDMISTVLVMDPKPEVGSLMLHAGWRSGDQAYGAPYDGYLPFPVALLRAVAFDPAVAYSLCRPVQPPTRMH